MQSDPDTTQRIVSVTKSGVGTGKVVSLPEGINCGSVCPREFTLATLVTLAAAPDTGSTFTGWSGGGCSGTGVCKMTVTENVAVTASFDGVPCTYTFSPKSKRTLASLAVAKAACLFAPQISCPKGYEAGSLPCPCRNRTDYSSSMAVWSSVVTSDTEYYKDPVINGFPRAHAAASYHGRACPHLGACTAW